MMDIKSIQMPNNNKNREVAANLLDSLLRESSTKKITENQILMILDALAGSDDPDLVARFPAVIAICARKGIALDSQALFSKYWESSPKRQILETLLMVSADLLRREGIKAPLNLEKIADILTVKYGNPGAGGQIQIGGGISIPIESMRSALRSYKKASPETEVIVSKPGWRTSEQLHPLLERLFSPKQKELVFKRLNDNSLTKTEREYYSRVVKKKLEAIADSHIQEIADILTRGR